MLKVVSYRKIYIIYKMCSSLFARLNRWKQNPCFFEEMLVKFRKYISCVIFAQEKNFICFEIKPYVSIEKKAKKTLKKSHCVLRVFVDVLARI